MTERVREVCAACGALGRGTCRKCGQLITIKADGTCATHTYWDGPFTKVMCSGGGQPPRTEKGRHG